MDTNNQAVNGQGPETASTEMGLKELKKAVKRDAGIAYNFLRCIAEDTELQDMIAKWFEGRMLNAKQQVENSRQTSLFPKEQPVS